MIIIITCPNSVRLYVHVCVYVYVCLSTGSKQAELCRLVKYMYGHLRESVIDHAWATSGGHVKHVLYAQGTVHLHIVSLTIKSVFSLEQTPLTLRWG